jgi:hypothetical protein
MGFADAKNGINAMQQFFIFHFRKLFSTFEEARVYETVMGCTGSGSRVKVGSGVILTRGSSI